MKMKLTLLFISAFFTCSAIFAQDVLYLDGSGASANLTIQTGAAVYVQGGYVANSNAQGMKLDGDLYVGLATGNTADWTDNMATTSVLPGSTGTVRFQSSLQQNISGANTVFYKVQFNNSSVNTAGIRLLSDMTVADEVKFSDGLVYANSNAMHITTTAPAAVTFSFPNTSLYGSSWLAALYSSNGRLDRDMMNSASTYDFPVGSIAAAQNLQVTPNNITGISRLSASWEAGVSGASPVSNSECGTQYTQINNYGEWHLRPANSGVYGSGRFAGGDMTLRANNLNNFIGLIDNQFAIQQRANGDVTTAGWSIPAPSCTSLAAAGSSGRTIAGNNALRNNLTDFSDATSQLGIGMTIVVLPIELLSFNGWNAGDVNNLSWSTASEFNSNYFDLERSADGSVFTSIGKMNSAGFSTQELNYHFTDEKPINNFNYYRLKMVDFDNTFTYSNMVLIQLKNDGTISTILSPNPTINNINIQLQSENDGEVELQLTDVTGRVLQSRKWNIVNGTNVTTVNTFGLPAAIYFIKIYSSAENISQTYQVLKEK